DEDVTRVFGIAEHHKQQQENQQQANGNNLRQPLGSPDLVFKFAGPSKAIAIREFYVGVNILLGFLNGTSQVSSAHGEFHTDKPLCVVAIDERRTGDLFY